MIIQQEFLANIKENFNLNIYEVKIWTSLLSRGIATAGELADISGVPRSRCYDVLESLEKKGFIIMKIGKPIKYIAVQPEEIVDRVKKNISEDRDTRLKIINSIEGTNVFKELELLHKTGIEKVDATELSSSIVGRNEIYKYIKNLVNKSKKSVVIATTSDGFARKINLLKTILASINKKGVSIKIVAPVDKKAAKKVSFVELKDVDPSVRFVAIDNNEILFMLSDDKSNPNYDSAVHVKSELFTSALITLFNNSLK